MNRYRLTDQRLRWEYGFIARQVEEVELFRVNDVAVKQGALERIVGIGDITCYTSDTTSPRKVLHNIGDAETVKDLIRSAVRRERERRRVMIREDMYGGGDELPLAPEITHPERQDTMTERDHGPGGTA